jgi:hydrogenase maturation factor HypF (carbamoyltransferase family)
VLRRRRQRAAKPFAVMVRDWPSRGSLVDVEKAAAEL